MNNDLASLGLRVDDTAAIAAMESRLHELRRELARLDVAEIAARKANAQAFAKLTEEERREVESILARGFV